MQTARFSAALVAAVALAAAAACGSGQSQLGSCIATSNGSACASCIESQCGSQLSAVSNACSAYVSCACPNGVVDPPAAESASCQANLQATSCQSADGPFAQCVNASCASACNGSSGSSSGGSGSGSSSGGYEAGPSCDAPPAKWTDCDGDRVPDPSDNCPGVPNASQDASACAVAKASCASLVNGTVTDFTQADLRGCAITGIVSAQTLGFRGADLSCATMTGSWGAEYPVIDFTGAKMHRFSFDGNWDGTATFDGADLSEAQISGNFLPRSSFRNTNLTGFTFDGNFEDGLPPPASDAGADADASSADAGSASPYPPIDFTGANLTGAYVCGNWLGPQLVDATVTGLVCGNPVGACIGGTTGTSAACPITTRCP